MCTNQNGGKYPGGSHPHLIRCVGMDHSLLIVRSPRRHIGHRVHRLRPWRRRTERHPEQVGELITRHLRHLLYERQESATMSPILAKVPRLAPRVQAARRDVPERLLQLEVLLEHPPQNVEVRPDFWQREPEVRSEGV
jgi:hypothetical protein